MSWRVLLLLCVVVLVAYTVFGATGFGSSIIAVPALAHALPLAFTVPMMAALDGVATLTAASRQWRDARFREIARLLPTMLVGIAAGVTVLVHLPRTPALLVLGTFAAAYGVYVLVGSPRRAKISHRWAWPIGFAGGVFSALFGTGGPIYMIYLSSRIDDKGALRATSSLLITISVVFRIAAFVASGLLTQRALLATAALMVPCMLAGFFAGSRLHDALSGAGVMRLIAVLLVGNGVLLIVRALGIAAI